MPTQGQARLRVLADLSVAFARVTDYHALLETIASRTAEIIGDGCLVTLLAPDGDTLLTAATAHRDPALASVYVAFLAEPRTMTMTSGTIASEVMRTGIPRLATEVEPAAIAGAVADPALHALAIELDVRSFIIVPIRARGSVLGTLSLYRSGPGRGYTAADQTLLEDLAERAGLAIDHARLYEALRQSEEQLRQVLEAAPTGMLTVDAAGRVAFANAAVERQFGYTRDELLGKPVEMLLPERLHGLHAFERARYLTAPRIRSMGGGLHGRRKDGSEIPLEIGLSPLQGATVLATVVDVSERKQAEREREDLLEKLRALNAVLEERVRERTAALATTLREREVLLQEVHHRVKNNLQVISSLINMQLRKLPADATHEALEECQTRVLAIALIHEQLYQSSDYAQVQFADYVRGLAGAVFEAVGVAPREVALELAISDVPMRVDVAIPCGLVLVELITNALKHAFQDRQRGRVRVELVALAERRLRLRVEDDGVGLPAGFEPYRAASMGLRLVCTLCAQLRGELAVEAGPGAAFQITFPADD